MIETVPVRLSVTNHLEPIFYRAQGFIARQNFDEVDVQLSLSTILSAFNNRGDGVRQSTFVFGCNVKGQVDQALPGINLASLPPPTLERQQTKASGIRACRLVLVNSLLDISYILDHNSA
ncbi:hypothetical protein D3C77_386060 [compost metagenome]